MEAIRNYFKKNYPNRFPGLELSCLIPLLLWIIGLLIIPHIQLFLDIFLKKSPPGGRFLYRKLSAIFSLISIYWKIFLRTAVIRHYKHLFFSLVICFPTAFFYCQTGQGTLADGFDHHSDAAILDQ